MIIPIGHEETLLRRVPIVSFSLILLNILIFLYGLFYFEKDADFRLWKALEYYWSRRDYLTLPEGLVKLGITDERLEEAFGAIEEDWADGSGDLPEGFQDLSFDEEGNLYDSDGYDEDAVDSRPRQTVRRDEEAEQEELESLARAALQRSRTVTYHNWAIEPGNPKLIGSLTYMFLHSGWWVLLINLYFLYLAGTVVEDRYGRVFFAFFYVLGGVLTGLVCQVQFGDTASHYLVNSTGAVSAVLGAFLVCYRRNKIMFGFIFSIILRGTFSLPALVVLPLWLILKSINLLLSTTFVSFLGAGMSLAVMDAWNSFWGMLLGVGAIALIRLTPLETSLVPADVPEEEEGDIMRAALKEERLGRGAVALELLKQGVREQPENSEILLEYWRLAHQLHHQSDIALAGQKLIREDLDQGDSKMAFMRWKEIREGAPQASLPPALISKLTEALVAEQYFLEAEDVLRQCLQTMRNPLPLHLVRLIELAVEMRNPVATDLVAYALEMPNLTVEDRHNIKLLQAKSSSFEAGSVGPQFAAIEVSGSGGELFNAPAAMTKNVHSLNCHQAQPVSADAGHLTVKIDGAHQKKVPFDQIKAMATGVIREENQKPYLLIDLIFDPLFDILPQHRVLRIDSRDFNPKVMVPGAPDAKTAFARFIQVLLKRSGADPLPDANAIHGNPYADFPDLRAYERAIYF